MDMKLEVVPIPVRNVDAAKDFYTQQVGFKLDNDVRPSDNMRVVQMTPPGSACSVVIGEGIALWRSGRGGGEHQGQDRGGASLAQPHCRDRHCPPGLDPVVH
jgi:catechol 2,3-dioxygenase-like lactoylglutathione lyase family enzyme